MLYMVIEAFKNGDPDPVYRRFRDEGRLAPGGLGYADRVARRAYGIAPRCFSAEIASQS